MDTVKEARGGRPRERELTPMGQRIDALLAQRGLTVRSLADNVSVSPHCVYNIMFGKVSQPRLTTLRQIAEGLGTTREKLVDGIL